MLAQKSTADLGSFNGCLRGRSANAVFKPIDSFCNDVFVEVRNKVVAGETQLACGEGDSGGPWFANGVAFNIHSGCRYTGTRPGQTEAAFYTSIEKASALNVTIFIP